MFFSRYQRKDSREALDFLAKVAKGQSEREDFEGKIIILASTASFKILASDMVRMLAEKEESAIFVYAVKPIDTFDFSEEAKPFPPLRGFSDGALIFRVRGGAVSLEIVRFFDYKSYRSILSKAILDWREKRYPKGRSTTWAFMLGALRRSSARILRDLAAAIDAEEIDVAEAIADKSADDSEKRYYVEWLETADENPENWDVLQEFFTASEIEELFLDSKNSCKFNLIYNSAIWFMRVRDEVPDPVGETGLVVAEREVEWSDLGRRGEWYLAIVLCRIADKNTDITFDSLWEEYKNIRDATKDIFEPKYFSNIHSRLSQALRADADVANRESDRRSAARNSGFFRGRIVSQSGRGYRIARPFTYCWIRSAASGPQ